MVSRGMESRKTSFVFLSMDKMLMESVYPLCSGVRASEPKSSILILSLLAASSVDPLYKVQAENDSPAMDINSNNNIIFFLSKILPPNFQIRFKNFIVYLNIRYHLN